MSVAFQVHPVVDDLAAFSEAVGLVYESRLDPTRAAEVPQAIRRLLSADDIVFSGAIPENTTEFYKRANGRLLCLDIAGPAGRGIRLMVRRGADKPPFNDRDVSILSLLRPHLQRAEWLGALLSHGVLGTVACNTFVSLMNEGLIVANTAAEVHWCNPAADAILSACDGLCCVDGRLKAGRAFENSNLTQLLRDAAQGRPGVMLVGRPSKHPLGLTVTKLPAQGTDRQNSPLLMIAVKEIEREIEVLAGRLGDLFGMTAAEEKLAILLLNGHTLQSAAETSRKTLATVKTQLHSLLKKTGARGQADLINVLLSLPSLI